MVAIRKIYIIGFMGCGKSTTGKKLASALGWQFIDMDNKIEEDTGKTVSEIFAQSGEDWFRKIESEILYSLNDLSDTVISTGGGTPCFANNMDQMNNSGLTIYLKMTPGQLVSRLSGSTGKRPLIKDMNTGELYKFVEAKLSSREYWYNRATMIVDGMDVDINLMEMNVKSVLNI